MADERPELVLLVNGERVTHPRGAEALDAALCVLLGKAPPWVEQLAAEWEQEALVIQGCSQLEADALNQCAAELRARAKGTP